ncbi:MAG TPA: hypothetical protein VIN10_03050, partial [Bacteroidales bacterium]
MKTIAKLLVIMILALTTTAIFAQNPPDPNGGNNPGSGNTPVGGRAAVSGGLIVLLALGAGYGAKKVY